MSRNVQIIGYICLFYEMVETLNLGCDSKKNFSSRKSLQTQTETCKKFLLTKSSHKNTHMKK